MSLIEERAHVLRVEQGTAWLRCESQAGCQRCAEGRGCGGGVFARLLRRRLEEMPVENSIGVSAGDAVLVGLEPAAVQNAAFMMYGLPLAGLLLGAVLGSAVGPAVGPTTGSAGQDAIAILAGAIGFAIGFAVARWSSKRLSRDARYRPVLLRRLRPGEPCPALLDDNAGTDDLARRG